MKLGDFTYTGEVYTLDLGSRWTHIPSQKGSTPLGVTTDIDLITHEVVFLYFCYDIQDLIKKHRQEDGWRIVAMTDEHLMLIRKIEPKQAYR